MQRALDLALWFNLYTDSRGSGLHCHATVIRARICDEVNHVHVHNELSVLPELPAGLFLLPLRVLRQRQVIGPPSRGGQARSSRDGEFFPQWSES